MAAVLSPAEYEFARGLQLHEIPTKLRCAKCNRPVFEAMKTDCCDTTICKSCSENLAKACPACAHPITSDMTREDKRMRVTLKAHIKGELQKRNNAQAAALAAQQTAQQTIEEPPAPAEEDAIATIQIDHEPAVEVALELQETLPNNEEEGDHIDDHSSVEIITDLPGDHEQIGQEAETQEMDDAQEEIQPEDHEEDAGNVLSAEQGAFNNNMGMPGMNAFNPMLAMQAGIGMPFNMMSGMMGMPNMGMDPTMMFNGFAGMNGMANMMNGSMMGSNFGMGDMNDFTSYNHQYATRHGQNNFFPSNRGYGRGGFGQNFRGRGQDHYHRGGRGRGGGWNNQYHHQNNNFQQQNYSHGRARYNQQADAYPEAQSGPHDDARDAQDASHSQLDESNAAVDPLPEPDSATQQTGEYVEDEVDYDDDLPLRDEPRPTQATSQQHEATQPPSPPRNAPTGPKAMRDGLPNSGRYSRPQVSLNGRDAAATEQSKATISPYEIRPSSSSASHAMSNGDRGRDKKDADQHEHDKRARRRHGHDRSRSRSPPRDDYKRHSDYKEKDRSLREESYDIDQLSRKKRVRESNVEEHVEKKKRSRSITPDDSSSHRHRSRREHHKDYSRRDHSREKRKSGNRYDSADDDEYYRRKSKSSKSSSRRERSEYHKHDDSEVLKSARPAVLEQQSDEIGFRIKGSKSRELKSSGDAAPTAPAGHRDPYAEERERMKEQRLQRDAQRRHNTQSGKRGRDEESEHHHDDSHGKKKRSRPRAKYEDEIENHEHERESRRWR